MWLHVKENCRSARFRHPSEERSQVLANPRFKEQAMPNRVRFRIAKSIRLSTTVFGRGAEADLRAMPMALLLCTDSC
jgi:hypothetical protein